MLATLLSISCSLMTWDGGLPFSWVIVSPLLLGSFCSKSCEFNSFV